MPDLRGARRRRIRTVSAQSAAPTWISTAGLARATRSRRKRMIATERPPIPIRRDLPSWTCYRHCENITTLARAALDRLYGAFEGHFGDVQSPRGVCRRGGRLRALANAGRWPCREIWRRPPRSWRPGLRPLSCRPGGRQVCRVCGVRLCRHRRCLAPRGRRRTI